MTTVCGIESMPFDFASRAICIYRIFYSVGRGLSYGKSTLYGSELSSAVVLLYCVSSKFTFMISRRNINHCSNGRPIEPAVRTHKFMQKYEPQLCLSSHELL